MPPSPLKSGTLANAHATNPSATRTAHSEARPRGSAPSPTDTADFNRAAVTASRAAAGLPIRALFFFASMTLAAQSFEKDLQPIFKQYCYGCHAATVKMGTLDVETHEGLMRGGNQGPIIVPGKPQESRLLLVLTGEMKPAMPMDGRKLAAGEIDIVRKWIANGAKPEANPTARPSSAIRPDIKPRVPVKPANYALAWKGNVIAAGGHKRVRLFDANGKQSGALDGHAEVVRAVAISPDGQRLAAAGGLPSQKGEVKIWNLATKQVEATIEGHTDCIYAVAFSPDGKTVATASYDKMIYLWDAATGKQIRPMKDHIDAVYALSFTSDGKLISAAADRTVKIWNPQTGERLYTFSESTDGVNGIAVSPDGKTVAAAGGDKTIRLWSVGDKSGELKNSLIAHEDTILRLAISPDGSLLASTSADRTIKLFRTADLSEAGVLPNQSEWVLGLAFSADGRRLAAARLDGTLEFYEMESIRNAPAASRTANR